MLVRVVYFLFFIILLYIFLFPLFIFSFHKVKRFLSFFCGEDWWGSRGEVAIMPCFPAGLALIGVCFQRTSCGPQVIVIGCAGQDRLGNILYDRDIGIFILVEPKKTKRKRRKGKKKQSKRKRKRNQKKKVKNRDETPDNTITAAV